MDPQHGSPKVNRNPLPPPQRKKRKRRPKKQRPASFGGAKIGKCQRIPLDRFDEFQEDLLRKIPKVVQLEFYHSFWLSMEDSILKDDGKDLCPASIYWVDGAKIFLYWIALYPPYSDFKKFDCCQSTVENIRNWGLYHSRFFLEKYLKGRTYEERKEATDKLKLERHFQYITSIIDGRHSRIRYCQSTAHDHYVALGLTEGPLDHDAYFSFKSKKSALNTQMAIGLDMYVEWVSTYSLPAGEWNDITQIKDDLESLFEVLEPGRDCVCVDGGYQSLDQYIGCIIPHRKPKERELTEGELKENRQIGHLRSKIERKFAHLVNRFQIVKGPFRLHDSFFNPCFRIACALSNCLLLNKDRMRDREVTSHPIFKYPTSEDYWTPEPPRTVVVPRPEKLYSDRPVWMILKQPRPSDYVEPIVQQRPVDDFYDDSYESTIDSSETTDSSTSESSSSINDKESLSVSTLSSISDSERDPEEGIHNC